MPGGGSKPGERRGGRKKGTPNKSTTEVRDLAQKYTYEAIERLAYWMREGDAKSSISAAQALLDRAHGKPAQALEHSGGDGGAPIEVIVKKFEYDGDDE